MRGIRSDLERGEDDLALRHLHHRAPRGRCDGSVGIADITAAVGTWATTDRMEAEISGQSVIRRPIDPELRFPDVSVAWRANAPRRLREQLADVREAARELYKAAAAAASASLA